MNKKFFTIISAVLLCGMLITGCGAAKNNTPKEATIALLDTVKNDKLNEISAYVLPDQKYIGIAEASKSMGFETGKIQNFVKQLNNIEYKIGDETITDDRATVKVDMNIADFSVVLSPALPEIISQAKGDNAVAIKGMMDVLIEGKPVTTQKSIVVHLVKKDGKWFVDLNNIELLNALNGNVLGSLNLTTNQ